jgi:fumarylacetoacetase
MTSMLDETHAPGLTSWVASANANDIDFPIQNLPFGRFRPNVRDRWRIGVAIGDQVLDLSALGLAGEDMNQLMAMPAAERRALRHRLSRGLRSGSADESIWRPMLSPIAAVEMGLPCHIPNYTDFYVGIHHATTVGKLFRPDNPLLPNYKWVPIGYHGRASSINVSPSRVRRPAGQQRGAEGGSPAFGPSRALDHELEVALFVGPGNAQGEPIPIGRAEEHLFGMALFNDWSARDLQAWEYQPLGPFLSKNFASTVSPWIVTMEALAPFRRAFERAAGDPQPLPYLDSAANRAGGAIAIELEAWLQTQAMRQAGSPGDRISYSNLLDGYWTAAQLVAHHTVGGCNLQPGDLLGSGTLSGPRPGQGGSLLELTEGGRVPLTLSNGERRTYLQDGDAIVLRGHCRAEGARRIGFGACVGTVERTGANTPIPIHDSAPS